MRCLALLLPATFLLYYGCSKPKKTEPQLPPLTHTGANVVAFKANGKVCTATSPNGSFNLFTHPIYAVVYGDSNAVISASGYNPDFILTIGSKYRFVLGTYKIENTPYSQGALFQNFGTDSTHTGSITYTYYDRNIVAGTFAFDAVNANDSVVHITDGRFDIRMN